MSKSFQSDFAVPDFAVCHFLAQVRDRLDPMEPLDNTCGIR